MWRTWFSIDDDEGVRNSTGVAWLGIKCYWGGRRGRREGCHTVIVCFSQNNLSFAGTRVSSCLLIYDLIINQHCWSDFSLFLYLPPSASFSMVVCVSHSSLSYPSLFSLSHLIFFFFISYSASNFLSDPYHFLLYYFLQNTADTIQWQTYLSTSYKQKWWWWLKMIK